MRYAIFVGENVILRLCHNEVCFRCFCDVSVFISRKTNQMCWKSNFAHQTFFCLFSLKLRTKQINQSKIKNSEQNSNIFFLNYAVSRYIVSPRGDCMDLFNQNWPQTIIVFPIIPYISSIISRCHSNEIHALLFTYVFEAYSWPKSNALRKHAHIWLSHTKNEQIIKCKNISLE